VEEKQADDERPAVSIPFASLPEALFIRGPRRRARWLAVAEGVELERQRLAEQAKRDQGGLSS
jgi:hypothetical protein